MSRAEALTAEMVAWVVDQIERGAVDGSWVMPWHRIGVDQFTPTNAATGRPYTGGNRWMLALTAMMRDLDGGSWATFNQWRKLGHPVRKGERAAGAVAVPIERKRTEEDPDAGDETEHRILIFRQVPVFHSSQVEDWTPATVEGTGPERIAHAEELVAAWTDAGMVIEHGGDRAYYSPGADKIRVPDLAQFRDAEHYYSTVAHEATHWTGHPSRLGRDLAPKFDRDRYAAEELVAELGAATIAAHLGIAATTREDHAQYLAGWVQILNTDPQHLWTVAGKAETATTYLLDLATAIEADAA